MLLVVDVGNTNTSFGVFEDEHLKAELRFCTNRNWTRDEIAVALHQGLALRGLQLADLDDAVVACVVPPALAPLVACLQESLHKEPVVVGPGTKTGMPVRYDAPQDVGADRIVAAVAAWHLHGPESAGGGMVVVDFGTATTFDVISPRPEYLGGAIAPGIGIAADALFARASKLPRVDLIRPESVIGRNTVAALQSGLVYGYVGLVDGMIRRIRATVDWPVRVVATGGLASLVASETEAIDRVDDTLMLEGLRLVYLKNRGKT